MGKTQIAFFDIQSMGGLSQFVYLVVIVSAFAGLMYYFKTQLMEDTPDDNALRRQKIAERRARKQQ